VWQSNLHRSDPAVWQGDQRSTRPHRLGVLVLTESTKKLRDPLALALLGAAALYLVTTFFLLFKDVGDFADRAAALQGAFTDPAWILVVLTAVALVAAFHPPSPQARLVTMVALGVLGFMLLLGVITWLAAYGAGPDFEVAGKIAGTFYALARLLLVAVAGFLAYHLFTSMPAPVRQPRQQGRQQWSQPGQPQWGPGQQGGYGQQAPHGQQAPYGQQGAYGQQGQWVGPAAGGAAPAWGAQPGSDPPASGQSSSGYAAGGDQPQWGQHDPYAPPASSGQSSAGYAAGGEPAPWDQQHGAYAAPATSGQPPSGQSSSGYAAGDEQSWGEPQHEGPDRPTESWDQPPSEIDPNATVVREPGTGPDPGASQPSSEDEQDAREDDQRPGWWAPGS
jgi:hypothetical protein